MTQEIKEFEVLLDRKEEAIAALEKLIRRAHKAGNTDITYEIVGETKVRRSYEATDDNTGEKVLREVVLPALLFRVTGEAPKYAGYIFLAKIEFLDGEDQLAHLVPGVKIPLQERFHKTDCACDHCQVNRVRNDVFVVHHEETGAQKQVGRTCLRDFLGIDTPEKVVSRFGFWSDLGEFEDGWGSSSYRGPAYHSLDEILSLTAADIRGRGYVSNARADDNNPSTSGRIRTALWPSRSDDDQQRFSRVLKNSVADEDRAVVQAAKEYFAALEPKNEYEQNVKTLIKYDVLLKEKHFGLVVSGIAAYLRHVERLNQLEVQRRRAADSAYVGEPKERLRGLVLTLDKVIVLGQSRFNQYGETKLRIYHDDQGNIFTWISEASEQPGVGIEAKYDATVKAHKDYNGAKQTVLTRVKWLDQK